MPPSCRDILSAPTADAGQPAQAFLQHVLLHGALTFHPNGSMRCTSPALP